MSSFANVLKNEVRRLARKELKAELATVKKASAQYRRDIAALKRELGDQKREIASLRRRAATAKVPPSAAEDTNVRFSPKWLKAHREKLEISAEDYAALVGVSGQTIYNWERGATRPRAAQLQAWAEVRGLGKREAWKRLDELEG